VERGPVGRGSAAGRALLRRIPAGVPAKIQAWGRVLAVALGVGALAGAGQLGVAYGLGLVRFARSFSSDGLWSAQLTWVAWFAALAALAGAAAGAAAAQRHRLDRQLGGRIMLAVAAGLGAAVVLPLTALPADGATLVGRTAALPALEAALAAGLGMVVGVLAAVAAQSVRLVALSVTMLVGIVWLLALVSVAPSLAPTAALPEVRLGVLDLPGLDGARSPVAVLSAPVVAVLICGVIAFAARSRGLSPLVTAVSSTAAPGLLALVYLIGSPGTGDQSVQTAPYAGALIAVAAGLLVSLVVGVVRLPSGGDTGDLPDTYQLPQPVDGGPDPDRATSELPRLAGMPGGTEPVSPAGPAEPATWPAAGSPPLDRPERATTPPDRPDWATPPPERATTPPDRPDWATPPPERATTPPDRPDWASAAPADPVAAARTTDPSPPSGRVRIPESARAPEPATPAPPARRPSLPEPEPEPAVPEPAPALAEPAAEQPASRSRLARLPRFGRKSKPSPPPDRTEPAATEPAATAPAASASPATAPPATAPAPAAPARTRPDPAPPAADPAPAAEPPAAPGRRRGRRRAAEQDEHVGWISSLAGGDEPDSPEPGRRRLRPDRGAPGPDPDADLDNDPGAAPPARRRHSAGRDPA
jgi:hypothetical protein